MSEDRSKGLGFRCEMSMVHLVRAAAAKRGELPSDWLRRAVEERLQEELADASEWALEVEALKEIEENLTGPDEPRWFNVFLVVLLLGATAFLGWQVGVTYLCP